MEKKLSFVLDAHLGDSALSIMAIKRLLEFDKDLCVDVYYKNQYHSELIILYTDPRFNMIGCDDVSNVQGIKTWVGNNWNLYFSRMSTHNRNFVLCVMEHMDDIFESLGYGRILNKDLVNFRFDFDSIKNSKWFGNTDFDMIVNTSKPMSGQYQWDESLFVDFINRHKNDFRIAMTYPINGVSDVFCTYDNGLTLSDVGALAINTKLIIAGTAPVLFSANKWSVDKYWYMCDNYDTNCTFQNGTFIPHHTLRDITNIQFKRK